MTTAKKGDLVFVHYTGTFDSGEVFDSSKNSEPIKFILGSGSIIEGFDTAIKGMDVGETKTIKLTPETAYGEYSPEKVISTSRDNFGEGFEPEKDLQLALQLDSGQKVIATVTDFNDSDVTLDLNHPLAGKNLNFELELVEIKDAASLPSCQGSCQSGCSGC